MTTSNLDMYNVHAMDNNELTDIYGGGVLYDLGKAVGYAVGYAAGVIKDAVLGHGEDVANAGNTASVLAYK